MRDSEPYIDAYNQPPNNQENNDEDKQSILTELLNNLSQEHELSILEEHKNNVLSKRLYSLIYSLISIMASLGVIQSVTRLLISDDTTVMMVLNVVQTLLSIITIYFVQKCIDRCAIHYSLNALKNIYYPLITLIQSNLIKNNLSDNDINYIIDFTKFFSDTVYIIHNSLDSSIHNLIDKKLKNKNNLLNNINNNLIENNI